ncbi:mas-related G-protein coupled receptor member D [Sorex araneus]|uniref:mas-related G-protein coupled receptor member D n=1 Tax=Sorex araneus TaxID=42254 RepID=UPI0024336F1E|nr:mas-related G-protein coupled receptor member D [Sorex araneus]
MNRTENGSQALGPETDVLDAALWGLRAFITGVCILGIAGNGAVAWLLGAHVPRAPYCVYVLHLALADLLFLLCAVAVLQLDPASLAYEAVKRVKSVADTAGLGLLTAISVQRCLSVLFPVWYRSARPRHLSSTVCALLWALAGLANALLAALCVRHPSPYVLLPGERCFLLDFVFRLLTLGVFTPLMALSSLLLFLQVQKVARRRARRRRPTRLYSVILASVLAFLACTLPLGIYWLLIYLLGLSERANALLRHLGRLSSAAGCSVHPLIYFLVDRWRGQGRGRAPREPLGSVLQRVLQEEPELGPGEPPSPATGSTEGP